MIPWLTVKIFFTNIPLSEFFRGSTVLIGLLSSSPPQEGSFPSHHPSDTPQYSQSPSSSKTTQCYACLLKTHWLVFSYPAMLKKNQTGQCQLYYTLSLLREGSDTFLSTQFAFFPQTVGKLQSEISPSPTNMVVTGQ